jgi:hypothetical protein
MLNLWDVVIRVYMSIIFTQTNLINFIRNNKLETIDKNELFEVSHKLSNLLVL